MAESNKNKALITGASAGIGTVFAKELAARDYDLVLVARRQNKLREVSEWLQQEHSINTEIIISDLGTRDGIDEVVRRIGEMPELTMLVNNAGFGTIGYFTDIDIKRHIEMISVHVTATVRLCHAALPAMIASGRGDIINVSSVSGFMDNPGGSTYNPTKAYLNSFSKTLRNEVEEHGIRVQALCPGFTTTEFHEVGDFAGYERSAVPSSWWMSPEYVVGKSLKDLEKGKAICIPHIRYKLIVALYRNRPIAALLRPLMMRKRWRKK